MQRPELQITNVCPRKFGSKFGASVLSLEENGWSPSHKRRVTGRKGGQGRGFFPPKRERKAIKMQGGKECPEGRPGPTKQRKVRSDSDRSERGRAQVSPTQAQGPTSGLEPRRQEDYPPGQYKAGTEAEARASPFSQEGREAADGSSTEFRVRKHAVGGGVSRGGVYEPKPCPAQQEVQR